MVVFSGIQISDPDSAFRVQPRLQYVVRRLHFSSDWDAKLYEKVLKGVSKNQSLKANCRIDFEVSDSENLKKVTDIAQKHGINIF